MQPREACLAQGFVQHDSGRIGEIKRTQTAAHGDAYCIARPAVQQCLGKARRFFSEYEQIAVFVLHIRINSIRARRAQMESPFWKSALHLFEAVVIADVEILPVIQPRTL